MKKRNISLILNILIVILEIIGFVIIYKYNNSIRYEYYTEDSNILALVSSLLLVIFMVCNKKIPKWLSTFKYMTTICLSVTFFVVVFILIPMANFNYYHYLFDGALLYQHFLCPILAIIAFIFFDDLNDYTIKDSIIGLALTLLYTIIIIPLNIFDIVIGPYPFLMVKEQTILMCVLWFIIIIGLAYLISFILRKLYLKFHLREAK